MPAIARRLQPPLPNARVLGYARCMDAIPKHPLKTGFDVPDEKRAGLFIAKRDRKGPRFGPHGWSTTGHAVNRGSSLPPDHSYRRYTHSTRPRRIAGERHQWVPRGAQKTLHDYAGRVTRRVLRELGPVVRHFKISIHKQQFAPGSLPKPRVIRPYLTKARV